MGKHKGGSGGTIVPRPIHRGQHRRGCFSIAIPTVVLILMVLIPALI